MSHQRKRRDSLDDSSDNSSFDSNEQLTDLEEEVRHTGKKERKTWVMRSGPSRSQTDSQQQSYAPVADDDQYGLDQPSGDDKYGDTGFGDDDYSTAEKGKKSSTSGQGAQGDYSDASADGYDKNYDDDGQAGSKDGKEKKKGNKKIWLWVGVAAILLLLILLGIYFFWLRSGPDDSESEKSSSSSSSSSNSTSTAASNSSSIVSNTTSASPISIALPSSSAQPVTTLPVSNQTVAATHISKPVASSTVRPVATTTSTAEDSATTFFAQITWFNDEDIVTPCGSNPNDGDYVVRVSEELYGDVNSVSPLCGKWISLYQLETDSYSKATIEGVCTYCTGNNIDLSRATFWALTQNMKLGTTLAQWWWTAKEDRPKNTLESQAPVAQATNNVKPQSTAATTSQNSTKEGTSSGFEPVGTEESATSGGGFEEVTSDAAP